eukprot:jgi/Astpho2/7555/Aster-02462
MVLAITIDLLFLVGKPVLEEAGGESKGKNATEAPLSPGSWTGNQFWLSSKKTQADEGYIGGQGSVGQGDHKGQTGKFEPSLQLSTFGVGHWCGCGLERLRGSEWAAVAVAAAGGMVLGVSAQDTASAGAPQTTLLMVNNGLDVRHVAHSVLAGPSFWSFVMLRYMVLMLSNGLEDAEGGPTAPGALRVLAAMSLLVGTVLGAVMAQLRRAGAAARPVSPRQAASTSASRTGFMLASRGSGLWTPAGILCSVALSAAGVLTQTRGLKDGNSVVVCTCAAVSSMASGVLAGLVALGEPLPATLGQRSTRLLAWLLIIAGVGALGAGPGFLAETARAIFRTVPVQVWAVLPTWWSVWLQQQVSPRADHLPLHGHTETLSKQRSLHRP